MIHIHRVLGDENQILCLTEGVSTATEYERVTCLKCIEIELNLFDRTLRGEPVYDKRSVIQYIPIVKQIQTKLTFKKDFQNVFEK